MAILSKITVNNDYINSTDLIDSASTEDEEEVPVSVVEVIKKCGCGGEFEYTPGMSRNDTNIRISASLYSYV